MGASRDDPAQLDTVRVSVGGSVGDTVQLRDPVDTSSAMIRLLEGESIAPFAAASAPDRYIPGEVIGAGGMGEVRGQTDRATGRSVAMKTMHVSSDAVSLRRFSREARIQSQLEHPAIVPVYDIGQSGGGIPYFTMKHVRGESLAKVITQLRAGDEEAERRFTTRKLLTILSTVALTLEYVHQRGVIHRDLKPENIMLGPFGEVYVLDWGLAAIVEEHEKMSTASASTDVRRALAAQSSAPVLDTPGRFQTAAGLLLGTPGYIAPELLEPSAEATPCSDVYALGAILFEVLTLERLHKGESIGQVLGSTMTLVEGSPRERMPDRAIAPELDALCRRATQQQPHKRLSSAGELTRAIEAYLDGDRDLARRRELAAEITRTAAASIGLAAPESTATAAEAAALRSTALDAPIDPGLAATAPESPAARELVAIARAAREQAKRTVTTEDRHHAMRDITTALGLDPDNAEARALLVRLLTEPPPEADKLAEEIGRPEALASFKLAAKMHVIVQLSYLMYIPLLLWMGIRAWWMFGVAAAAISAVFFTAVYYYKRPPADLQLPFPHLAMSIVALLAGQLLFGPLILVPGIAVGTGIAYLASFDRRAGWVVGGMLAVVVVPAALQFAGVIPPSYELVDGKLVVLPMMTELPPAATITLLLVTHAIVIVAGMYFAWQLRRAYSAAAKAQRLQSWQLSQLLPEQARRDVAGH